MKSVPQFKNTHNYAKWGRPGNQGYFSSLYCLVQWLTPGMTRANDYEQAELGKTEISLMHFSVSQLHMWYILLHTLHKHRTCSTCMDIVH